MTSTDMKIRIEFLKRYVEAKRTEIQTLTGNLSDLAIRLETVKYEMEWAVKEMTELQKNIDELEAQENGDET